ncbi:MAG: transglutaminase domain-containing protein [Bacteriovorax sp.]|nr:transglutaminase domain-containing protein [Bacteriovorax sp.]
MKRSFLSLFLALNLSMALSGFAHAFDFGKIIDKANENAASAIAGNVPTIPKVRDSKYFFSKDTAADSKWVMLNVSKENRKEQILLPVKDGRVSADIYLRYGPGVYDIAVSESKLAGKYDGGYYVGQAIKLENTDKRDVSFLLPSDLVQSDNAQIMLLARTITADSVDELDAAKKIHKYVATNVKYDFASYKDESYKAKAFDAVTTLKNLTGVCSGYSNLYAALLRSIGIRTKIIYGIGYITKTQTGDHAWNEIFINNEWKSVDVTWDSTTGRIFKYFNIAEEVFDQDHQKQTEQNF